MDTSRRILTSKSLYQKHGPNGFILVASILAIGLTVLLLGIIKILSGGTIDPETMSIKGLVSVYLIAIVIVVLVCWFRLVAYCYPGMYWWECENCGCPVDLTEVLCPNCHIPFDKPSGVFQRIARQCA